MFAGATQRLEREQQARAWQAWHIAALPRVDKFPALEKFMGLKREPSVQTPEEIKENIKRMFGIK